MKKTADAVIHGVHNLSLHLTNISGEGAGAAQLAMSLLPAIVKRTDINLSTIYLPDRGELSRYKFPDKETAVKVYSRFLPNPISRFLECTLFSYKFRKSHSLLVLGDLPLFFCTSQILFVQNANLFSTPIENKVSDNIKLFFSKLLFRLGFDGVRVFIVQTDFMRQVLLSRFPSVLSRVHIVQQPPPVWLIESGLKRNSRFRKNLDKLDLFYPASNYPHKNHGLLARISNSTDWPVANLYLTLDKSAAPDIAAGWVKYVGFLNTEDMISMYSHVDALLFLSKSESYGLPLIEAMFVGLPIVCPSLPYAIELCGDQAIYFDPDSPISFYFALSELHSRLLCGWWPDWSSSLEKLPKSWDDVALTIRDIVMMISKS